MHSPGRHFAVYEIKALVCHVLSNYDVRLVNSDWKEGVSKVPDAFWVGTMCSVDPRIKLQFRSRVQ